MKTQFALFLFVLASLSSQLSARPLSPLGDRRCPELSVPDPHVCFYKEYEVTWGSRCEARIKLKDKLKSLGEDFEEAEIVCERLDVDLRRK